MNRIKPLSVLMAAALLLSGCASVYTADELAKRSEDKFGKTLCIACAKRQG